MFLGVAQTLHCMMVLVDTSVWIRFLSTQTPRDTELRRLLNNYEVSGHQLVHGELLIGDHHGRKQLLADYPAMHQAPVVSHAEVVNFVRKNRLKGRGIGWIDAHLLAATLVGQLKLWSFDRNLAAVAGEFGVAYDGARI
jgi:predicted nucleic acid-binding protein